MKTIEKIASMPPKCGIINPHKAINQFITILFNGHGNTNHDQPNIKYTP